MISKFALLLTTLFLGVGMTATAAPATTENVLVQAVESLDTISVANYDDSYLGTIFYQPVDESKIEYVNNAVSRLSENDEVEEVDVDGKLLGKYFYEVEEGVVGEGYLIGTDFTTNEYLDKMVDEAKGEIESGSIQRDYQNANARSIVSMTIGDSWNSVVSQKFTWSLDYDGVHYGDYAEWYSSFRILTNNYRYYLIAHETYVAPNNDNTDETQTTTKRSTTKTEEENNIDLSLCYAFSNTGCMRCVDGYYLKDGLCHESKIDGCQYSGVDEKGYENRACRSMRYCAFLSL